MGWTAKTSFSSRSDRSASYCSASCHSLTSFSSLTDLLNCPRQQPTNELKPQRNGIDCIRFTHKWYYATSFQAAANENTQYNGHILGIKLKSMNRAIRAESPQEFSLVKPITQTWILNVVSHGHPTYNPPKPPAEQASTWLINIWDPD